MMRMTFRLFPIVYKRYLNFGIIEGWNRLSF